MNTQLENPKTTKPGEAIEKVQELINKGKLKEAGDYIDNISFPKVENERESKQISELWRWKDYIDNNLIKINKTQKEKIKELKPQVLEKLSDNKRRESTELIVNEIEKENHIRTTRDDLKPEMYIYKNGIYLPDGQSYIKEYCRQVLGEGFTKQLANEVLEKIEADTYVDKDDFFQDSDIHEIPVQNGILNIKTRELKEFTPEKVFFNKLPVKYDPEKDCPNVDKFLKDVLKSEDDKEVFYELLGAILEKKYRIAKAFMFVGNGRNGKGKTLELIKRFVGIKNTCSVPLKQLHSDSSSVCELHKRLVNVAGDLDNSDLKETGFFKMLTGGDEVQAKRKYLRDLLFINYAKFIFACNELPRVYDVSDGFWDRWILLEFPYKFIDKKEYDKLPENQKENKKIKDDDIINKILNEDELSGLLNRALDGFDRVLENSRYSITRGTEEVKNFWIRQADSFKAFCMDCIEEDPDAYMTKKRLRKEFHKYCKAHRLKGVSDLSIKASLQEMFGAIDGRPANDEERDRCWLGIKLKQNYKEKLKVQGVQGISKTPGNSNSRTLSKTMDTMDMEQKGKIKPLETMDFYNTQGRRVRLEENKEYLAEDLDPETFQILIKSPKIKHLK